MSLSLFLMIAVAIAAGTILTYVVFFSYKWLKNKIQDLIRNRNAKKVIVSDIVNLANKCENKVNVKDLDDLVKQGFSKVVAAVDENDQLIDNVEFYKDKNVDLDADVEELLGKEKMVVVEA